MAYTKLTGYDLKQLKDLIQRNGWKNVQLSLNDIRGELSDEAAQPRAQVLHGKLKIDVLYPSVVTFKMAFGALCAWLFHNHYFLLKFGWKVTVKDGELNEF